MGSDGIWDKFDNTEVVDVVKGVNERVNNDEMWYSKGA